MGRLTFSLRFVLFWLVPYAVVTLAIWGARYEADPVKHREYFGFGARCTLFVAVTCAWITALGVTSAVRRNAPR
jgi:hypothetical protein